MINMLNNLVLKFVTTFTNPGVPVNLLKQTYSVTVWGGIRTCEYSDFLMFFAVRILPLNLLSVCVSECETTALA